MSTERIRLQIDHIGKSYGARTVLRGVCAELDHGDTLVVTGRNGVGKSTLLRIIAGLLRPSYGAVHCWSGDTLLTGEHRRLMLGFVGADVHLYRELTAWEHLELVARLRGLSLEDGAALLDRVGLAGRQHEQIAAYSSGMVQRLRYVLALFHAPRLLVLDEPTTNLDAAGIKAVDTIVEQGAAHGIVVIATNDPRDLRYGEYVLALDHAQPA